MRRGLSRLHRLNGETSLFAEVKRFCTSCGSVPEHGTVLHPDDYDATTRLYQQMENGHAAVASKNNTTAHDEGMPDPIDFGEMGLINVINPISMWQGFPKDRVSLEPILCATLGVSAAVKDCEHEAAAFGTVRASYEVTVGHIFEPDYEDGRPDRVDPPHLMFWRLIARTLKHPYEIWEQQKPGRQNKKGWAFFAAYQVNGTIRYHEVWVNRKRQIRSSYRLNGIDQARNKRNGIPIYVAY